MSIELNDVLANDQRAVALTTNRAERLGRTLVYDEAAVFRLAAGKIAEAWLYVDDQEAHAAFFR
jgi:ketosteroid isomerase-like protein